MKKILSIVFLVIPLLLFTSACGEETQAQVTSRVEQIAPAVQNAVERTKTAVEAVETATMEAVESVVHKKEEPVVESTEVVVEEKPAVEAATIEVKKEKPAAEAVEVKEETVVKAVAMAAPNPEGAKVFSQNCAACHAGGRNLVNAMKTLKKEALVKYDMYSKEAISYQVTNGKNAMPAFGNRLSSEQIEHLAQYVLAQADKGW